MKKMLSVILMLIIAIGLMAGCTSADPTVTSITIKNPADTVSFNFGEEFSFEGLVVEATMSNGTKVAVNSEDLTIDSSKYKATTAGTYEIVVTYKTISVSYNVTVNAPTLTDIEVSGGKNVFAYGEEFTSTGLVVKKVLSDGSKVTLSADDFTIDSSKFNNKVAGSYKISVTYEGKTVSYNVTVNAPVVTSLEVNGAKNEFAWGEAFSSKGLVVKKVMSDNSKTTLDQADYIVDSANYKKNVAGTYTITVIFVDDANIKATYDVTVNAPVITAIEVSGAKNVFAYGEDFASTGLVVNKIMSDNTKVALDQADYTVDSSTFKKDASGEYQITIRYNDDTTITANYKVTVKQALVVSGATAEIYRGLEFNCDGLTVKLQSATDKFETLTSDKYTVDSSNYDKTTNGVYTIVVKLIADETISASYEVKVIEPIATGVKITNVPVVFFTGDEFKPQSYDAVKVMSNGEEIALNKDEYAITINPTVIRFFETKGDYTLTVTYKTLSKDYTVNCKDRFELTTKPKTIYEVGEEISYEGLEVTFYNNNNKPMILDEFSFIFETDYNANVPGTYTVNIKRPQSKPILSYTVKVNEPYVTSLEITTPGKIEFKNNEDFTMGTLAVSKVFNDGTKVNIPGANLNNMIDHSAYDEAKVLDTASTVTITINYRAADSQNKLVKLTYDVTIGEAYVTGIMVDESQSTLYLAIDDVVVPELFFVNKVMSNNNLVKLTDFNVDDSLCDTSTQGDYEVAISTLDGKYTTYCTITVGTIIDTNAITVYAEASNVGGGFVIEPTIAYALDSETLADFIARVINKQGYAVNTDGAMLEGIYNGDLTMMDDEMTELSHPYKGNAPKTLTIPYMAESVTTEIEEMYAMLGIDDYYGTFTDPSSANFIEDAELGLTYGTSIHQGSYTGGASQWIVTINGEPADLTVPVTDLLVYTGDYSGMEYGTVIGLHYSLLGDGSDCPIINTAATNDLIYTTDKLTVLRALAIMKLENVTMNVEDCDYIYSTLHNPLAFMNDDTIYTTLLDTIATNYGYDDSKLY